MKSFTRAAEKPEKDAYLKLADEIEANLRRDILKPWFPAAVDKERGGFFQVFKEDWTRGEDRERSIVYQSRLIWTSAQAGLRYPEKAAEYKEYSKHGFEYLANKMWDAEHGGFFWALGMDGKSLRGGEKHVYGISFAMYALAANYKATKDERALDLAKKTFQWLEKYSHDSKYGGYIEALTTDGKQIVEVPKDGQRYIVGQYGFKSMNSHIHLLESVTALYEVWPDASVKTRLQELFEIVRDKVAVPPGCLNLYFNFDWRPVPDHDSFGHDVETAFLLAEAAAALGIPDDAATWKMARALVDHALEYGWDNELGGFYDRGSAFGSPTATDKIWWVEAEGLNALLLMHERYGKETTRYWDAFNLQWDFIRKFQTDAKNGGWRAQISKGGVAPRNADKSGPWTECYHQGRALLNVTAALRKLAEHGK